jgi:hypothetical protein
LLFKDHLRLKIYSYLSGTELLHKISLLNKDERKMLPGAGLLDQTKVIVYKYFPHNLSHLHYALQLVDAIEYPISRNSYQTHSHYGHEQREDQRQVFNGGGRYLKAELFAEVLQLWNLNQEKKNRVSINFKIDLRECENIPKDFFSRFPSLGGNYYSLANAPFYIPPFTECPKEVILEAVRFNENGQRVHGGRPSPAQNVLEINCESLTLNKCRDFPKQLKLKNLKHLKLLDCLNFLDSVSTNMLSKLVHISLETEQVVCYAEKPSPHLHSDRN